MLSVPKHPLLARICYPCQILVNSESIVNQHDIDCHHCNASQDNDGATSDEMLTVTIAIIAMLRKTMMAIPLGVSPNS